MSRKRPAVRGKHQEILSLTVSERKKQTANILAEGVLRLLSASGKLTEEDEATDKTNLDRASHPAFRGLNLDELSQHEGNGE